MTEHQDAVLGRLLNAILKTEPEEINCDECAELLDQYVEHSHSSDTVPQELLKIKAHLESCHCCQEVQEALEAAVQGMQESGNSNAS